MTCDFYDTASHRSTAGSAAQSAGRSGVSVRSSRIEALLPKAPPARLAPCASWTKPTRRNFEGSVFEFEVSVIYANFVNVTLFFSHEVPELVAQQLRAAIDPLQEEIKEEQASRELL